MAVSEVGRTLGELKARTGLTWSQLADTLGASSGDYVRKVASGAKPGANLAGVVSELMTTGSVSKAVPRRRAASGAIARTRAVGGSRRRADPRVGGAGGRQVFQAKGGALGWSQRFTAADPDAIRAAVRSAGRGRHRVSFRVRYNGRGPWLTIGGKGGYRPRDVLGKLLGKDGDEVAEFFTSQVGHYGADAEATPAQMEVEVIAE